MSSLGKSFTLLTLLIYRRLSTGLKKLGDVRIVHHACTKHPGERNYIQGHEISCMKIVVWNHTVKTFENLIHNLVLAS